MLLETKTNIRIYIHNYNFHIHCLNYKAGSDRHISKLSMCNTHRYVLTLACHKIWNKTLVRQLMIPAVVLPRLAR